jgi:hypothetical protein
MVADHQGGERRIKYLHLGLAHPASGPAEGFNYGEGGYDPNKCNVGFNEQTGQFQIEIKNLAEPKSKTSI